MVSITPGGSKWNLGFFKIALKGRLNASGLPPFAGGSAHGAYEILATPLSRAACATAAAAAGQTPHTPGRMGTPFLHPRANQSALRQDFGPYRAKMLGRRIRGGSGSARESLLNPRHAALTGCLCHCLCHSRADAPCAGPHGDPFFTSSGESIRPAARFWPLQGQNAWTPHTRRQRVCPGKSSKSSPRRSHGLPAPLPLPQLGRPARRRPWAGCSPPTARPPPNRPGHGRQPASWRR